MIWRIEAYQYLLFAYNLQEERLGAEAGRRIGQVLRYSKDGFDILCDMSPSEIRDTRRRIRERELHQVASEARLGI
jgi:hypothetical protein